MTQDEIIEMARQTGAANFYPKIQTVKADNYLVGQEFLERFAKLVEAHTRGKIFKPDWDNYRQGLIDGVVAEREACALVCDDLYRAWMLIDEDDLNPPDAIDCKRAIRARAQAEGGE